VIKKKGVKYLLSNSVKNKKKESRLGVDSFFVLKNQAIIHPFLAKI
jgi:hypothetical protein